MVRLLPGLLRLGRLLAEGLLDQLLDLRVLDVRVVRRTVGDLVTVVDRRDDRARGRPVLAPAGDVDVVRVLDLADLLVVARGVDLLGDDLDADLGQRVLDGDLALLAVLAVAVGEDELLLGRRDVLQELLGLLDVALRRLQTAVRVVLRLVARQGRGEQFGATSPP